MGSIVLGRMTTFFFLITYDVWLLKSNTKVLKIMMSRTTETLRTTYLWWSHRPPKCYFLSSFNNMRFIYKRWRKLFLAKIIINKWRKVLHDMRPQTSVDCYKKSWSEEPNPEQLKHNIWKYYLSLLSIILSFLFL